MKSRTALAVLLALFVLTSAFRLCLYAEEGSLSTLSREGVVTVLDFDGEANKGNLIPSGSDGIDAEQKTSCRQYEITNEGYCKITSAEGAVPAQCFCNCYIDFVFENSIVFCNTDYVVFSLSLGTENSFIPSSTEDGAATCLSFMGEGCAVDFYITRLGGEWVLSDECDPKADGATVFANLGYIADGAWFDLKLVAEFEKISDTVYPKFHLYVDGEAVFSGEGDSAGSSSSFDKIRLSVPSLSGDESALAEGSLCLDNLTVEAVSGSNADNPCDIAYLFKDGAPSDYSRIAEWENILYSIQEADGGITSYSEIVSAVGGSYPSVDPLRRAINSASSVSVSLKRDVVYDNECVSKTSGQTVFTLPAGTYSKNIYLNGCSLSHTPYVINSDGEREGAGGHFFLFSNGMTERSLNIVGGYNATGELSNLKREASEHCTFRANSGSTHTNTKINFTALRLTCEDETDTSQFTDGNFDGASWTFSNCDVNFSLSSTKFAGRSTAKDSVKFENCKVDFTKPLSATHSRLVFEGCDIHIDNTGIKTSNGTLAVYVSRSKISGGSLVPTNPEVITFGQDVLLSDISVLSLLEAGCYITANEGEESVVCPIAVRCLQLMANLTLYSDIRYNLYFPAGDVTAIDGEDVRSLDTVIIDGSVWHVYAIDFPAHEASVDRSIAFTVDSLDAKTGEATEVTLTKAVGITDYVSRVLANTDNVAEYTAAYALMSGLVDYVIASAEYFEREVAEEFLSLALSDNYVSSSNTDVPVSKTDKTALSGYISDAKLNVQESNVKFIFTVGSATSVKLSYVSANGITYENVYDECVSGREIELSLRAYDLNAEITIIANGSEVKGTYDLSAYVGEVKNIDEEAYNLLVKMYYYAVCAKAYKFE